MNGTIYGTGGKLERERSSQIGDEEEESQEMTNAGKCPEMERIIRRRIRR